MKLKMNKFKKWTICGICALLACMASVANNVYAEGYGINMSPLNQKIVLSAGETYTGSFVIGNPQDNDRDFKYKVEIKPFFVDENYKIYYEETEGVNQIVDWTKVDVDSGVLKLGDSQKITFTIDVPKDAPAGGQYVAITVNSVTDKEAEDSSEDSSVGLNMNQSIGMAQIVYAEIAGTTRHSGEIIDTSIPTFLLDGNIEAESTIRNNGNTHGTATYKLQIFPLFSGEEVYTNEADPQTKTILPNRTLINKTIWEQTPAMGIFNVKYTVEFEGVTTEVSKLVIKCPMWLLFAILFVIIGIIIWIVIRIRSRKKARAEVEE